MYYSGILTFTEPGTLCDENADVIFILDTSSSIWKPDFQKQLAFVDGVVSQFNVGPDNVRVGIMTYARYYYIKFKLNRYKNANDVRSAIKKIRHRQGSMTNTGSAIRFMSSRMFQKSYGGREGFPHIAIVITDGKSQRSHETVKAAKVAHDKGIEIYAIGVGPNVKESELREIASDPDDKYFFTVGDYDALLAEKDIFRQKACRGRYYTLRPTSIQTQVTRVQIDLLCRKSSFNKTSMVRFQRV